MALNLSKQDWLLFLGFALVVLTMPITLQPLGAAYPALMQKFCIYSAIYMRLICKKYETRPQTSCDTSCK